MSASSVDGAFLPVVGSLQLLLKPSEVSAVFFADLPANALDLTIPAAKQLVWWCLGALDAACDTAIDGGECDGGGRDEDDGPPTVVSVLVQPRAATSPAPQLILYTTALKTEAQLREELQYIAALEVSR